MEILLKRDMSKCDEFIHGIIPSKDDKFIDDCDKNIVNSKNIWTYIEYEYIDYKASEVDSEKRNELSKYITSVAIKCDFLVTKESKCCYDNEA